jgi:hypothetical protein
MGIASDLKHAATQLVSSDVTGFAPDTEPNVTRALRRDAGYDQTVEYSNHL